MLTDTGTGRVDEALSMDVPLSQAYGGRRVIELDVGISDKDFNQHSKELGVDVKKVAPLPPDNDTSKPIDVRAYATVFADVLRHQGLPDEALAAFDQALSAATYNLQSKATVKQIGEALTTPIPLERLPETWWMRFDRSRIGDLIPKPLVSTMPLGAGLVGSRSVSEVTTPESTPTKAPLELPLMPQFSTAIQYLKQGKYVLPRATWQGIVELQAYEPGDSQPRFFLIEEYAITSALGRYGMGRTVRTFSLFPGEATEIVMKTWRTDDAKSAAATTIMDSFGTTSASTFNTQLEKSAGSKSATSTGNSYTNEWHASGGFSLFVTAEAGGGETRAEQAHSSRERFASESAKAVMEHAATANANRDSTVSSSQEIHTATGREETTTRSLRNVNLRHCLNIVFRELNQEYITNLHLVGFRVGFQNGRIGSWRETPLAGLRDFVVQFVSLEEVDSVCSKIVRLCANVFDGKGKPVRVLEEIKWKSDGSDIEVSDAKPDANGDFPPPGSMRTYRFKPGCLGDQQSVAGVVLNRTTVILRTDSVVADALLSKGEALDSYARGRQEADVKAAVLSNERANAEAAAISASTRRADAITEGLNAITDPIQRVEAFGKTFRPVVVDGQSVHLNV